MRLFVAVNLPEEITGRLASVQDQLRAAQADVSWVRPGNVHLTLKFLGETEEARLAGIQAALAETARGHAPFAFDLTGLGSFGGRAPRVVWVGVEQGAEPLTRLAEAVEAGMAALGFAREKRGFTAHLTLGRVRSPRNAERLLAALAEWRRERFGSAPVGQVDLMESQLDPRGSIYTVRQSFPLARTLHEGHVNTPG
jgi:2'-5' RNA ligase